MASRADGAETPAAFAPTASAVRRPALPGVGSAIRASLSDYYFNSIRLVAANVVWGVVVIALVVLALEAPVAGILATPLLVIPTVSVFRVAGQIARGNPTASAVAAIRPSRADLGPSVALGLGLVASAVVLGSNLIAGLASGEASGIVIATLAGWGLIALWCYALVAWPMVADPERAYLPFAARLSLAVSLLFLHPARIAGLALVSAAMVVLSAILTVTLLTVAASFVALVCCRSVYPVADRLDTHVGRARS